MKKIAALSFLKQPYTRIASTGDVYRQTKIAHIQYALTFS